MSTQSVNKSTEPKAKNQIKACRADTKRGAYVKQLFTKEGVSAETSVLGVNSKGQGKLWPGITDTLGYGYEAKMVGATKNEKTGAMEGGVLTHFGKLPAGLDAPIFSEKKEPKAKAEKGAAKPDAKAKPAPKPKEAA